MIAVDLFTVETVWLQQLYVLFFIELEQPTGAFRRLYSRQLAWTSTERSTPPRFLIRDRDSTFTRDFDAGFRSEGVEIIRTPVRAAKANAIAERFVRTARAACLDWLLIVGKRHLERSLRVFVEHYNGHRPHRSLNLAPPDPQHASPRGRRSALSILRKGGWKRKGGGCGLRLLRIQAA